MDFFSVLSHLDWSQVASSPSSTCCWYWSP